MASSQSVQQDAETSPPQQMVQVWDLPTRLFHWLLVATVTAAAVTGFIAPEWWMGLHITAGYAIVLLLVFRFVWGVFGSEYARLVNLASSTRYLGAYVRGLALLRPPHYVGHNPVGALMIFAFFAVFVGLVVTGLMVQGGEEKQGPFAGVATYTLGNSAKLFHEILAFAALAMIFIHICGLVVESWLQNVNLVRGMISGWMPVPSGFVIPPQREARPLAALLIFSAVVVGAGGTLLSLARLPALGVPAMPINETYQAECGACHWSYHPSLLPRASWAAIMDSLPDHFGEDASLPPETSAEIAHYLDAFPAESWDTEAGNRLRIVSAAEPQRITKSPYWIAKHRDIDVATFKRHSVKSQGNCIACHKDGDSGRFDDQAIAIPKGARP